ncbi:MAG: hypothetical protein J0I19_06875 [Alphaproteobacteria bacterium]|nr:hypothetical protein [Alphaproteobacteria bacterium]
MPHLIQNRLNIDFAPMRKNGSGGDFPGIFLPGNFFPVAANIAGRRRQLFPL